MEVLILNLQSRIWQLGTKVDIPQKQSVKINLLWRAKKQTRSDSRLGRHMIYAPRFGVCGQAARTYTLPHGRLRKFQNSAFTSPVFTALL
jgi:hypothetical protein